MPECALAGYQITCSKDMHKHHIINRGNARGNPVVRQELDCDELIADVCSKHNVSRIADTKECRSLLLWQKVYEFGYDRMEKKVNGLSWKVQPHELTLDAMLDTRQG